MSSGRRISDFFPDSGWYSTHISPSPSGGSVRVCDSHGNNLSDGESLSSAASSLLVVPARLQIKI